MKDKPTDSGSSVMAVANDPLLALRIQSLIADKGMIVASANPRSYRDNDQHLRNPRQKH